MNAKVLLGTIALATAGVVVPATPASACITVYLPVIGSVCDPCDKVEEHTGKVCP